MRQTRFGLHVLTLVLVAVFLVVIAWISVSTVRVSPPMVAPAYITVYGWPIQAHFSDSPRRGITIIREIEPRSDNPIRGEWSALFSVGFFRDWLLPDIGISVVFVSAPVLLVEFILRRMKRRRSPNG